MNTQRVIRTPKRTSTATRRTGATTGWMILCTAMGFCAVAWFIVQWGSNANAAPSAQMVQSTPIAPTVYIDTPATQTQSQPSTVGYNPDPMSTLTAMLDQQGDGLLLVGGAVLGGIVLLLVSARFMTRLPKDPLATGLGRTLTLLETDHRANNLTPQRAIELARLAVADIERDHERAIAERTRAYDEAVAQLTKTQNDAIAAIRAEATTAVRQAQADASAATAREAAALQRVANTEAQVAQLSRDLDHTHQQLTVANSTIQTQAYEIATLNSAIEEATDTLETWQAAHKDVTAQYQALQGTYAQVRAERDAAQATATAMTNRIQKAEAAVATVTTEVEKLRHSKQVLAEEMATTQKELARLRGVSLRELPIVIPDREGDLTPYMTAIVGFIRGTKTDTGAADGERTTKPVISSWRDIRRLFQVLKGVGVRFAVAAHHAPKWVEAGEEPTRSATIEEVKTQDAGDKNSSTVPALTDSTITAHNGNSTDSIAPEADALLFQNQ